MFNLVSKRSSGPPIISREAYRMFVSLIFSAGMAFWAATLIGFDPLASINMETQDLPGRWMFLWDHPIHIIIGGALYGLVLVCVFWIYIEKLSHQFVPENLLVLLVDFVALSFMAGAAGTWARESSFLVLASMAMFCLLIRFFFAWQREDLGAKVPLFRNLVFLFSAYFVFLITLLVGSYVFGEGVDVSKLPIRLYWIVDAGMVSGIFVTVLHSLRHTTVATTPAPPHRVNDYAIRYWSPPRLCPAYGTIPMRNKVVDVAKSIFRGEEEFHGILSKGGNEVGRFLLPHLSVVHGLRDVETQAFVMAAHADSAAEVEVRAAWVYLAHWLDDMYDGPMAATIANTEIDLDGDVHPLLECLDDRLASVWSYAMEYTERECSFQRRDLFMIGMKRLILGGPLFSFRCLRAKPAFQEKHRSFVMANLKDGSAAAELLRNVDAGGAHLINDEYLSLTTKVVVEVWDSFYPDSEFGTSMLMNLFYAPGLYHHDVAAEREREQSASSASGDVASMKDMLVLAMESIKSLEQHELAVALRPVPLFLACFEPVLKEAELWRQYQAFVKDPIISPILAEL